MRSAASQCMIVRKYLNSTRFQFFLAWIVQALRAASFRMRLPQPSFVEDMLDAVNFDDR
jgi:hypothetical protein